MYKINSNIEKIDDNDNKTRKILFETLFKTWKNINEYYLHDLI